MIPSPDTIAPPSSDERLKVPFAMQELDAAISVSRRSSVPGSEGITYAARCHLVTEVRHILLSFDNTTWESGNVQGGWICSRILAWLKPGKCPIANPLPTDQSP